MKRRIAALLVAVMVLCFATTVFAADSSKAGTQVKGDGQLITEIKDLDLSAYDNREIPNPDPTAWAKDKNYKRVDYFDLSSPTMKVTFYNVAWKKGQKALALHFNYADWKWEIADEVTVSKNGQMTADFTKTGLSPIALYSLSETTTSTTSPKTGEMAMMPVLVLLCAAGAVYFTRKARA